MLIDKPMLQSKACKLEDAIRVLRWIYGSEEREAFSPEIRFRDTVRTCWRI